MVLLADVGDGVSSLIAAEDCDCQLLTLLTSWGAGGVDVSMLTEAVQLVNGKVDTEASGNVTIDTVRAIAESGVTYISCGALTHSFQALDISLKISIQD